MRDGTDAFALCTGERHRTGVRSITVRLDRPLGGTGVLYRDPARLVKREGDDVLVFARDASLDKSRQKHGPVFVLGVNVRQDRAQTTGPAGADVARHKKMIEIISSGARSK